MNRPFATYAQVRGMTLVELLISMAATSIIMAALVLGLGVLRRKP